MLRITMSMEQFIKLILITIILTLGQVSTSKESSLAQFYRSETESFLLKLKLKGVTEIACKNQINLIECTSPDELLTVLKALNFIEVDKFEKGPRATRTTAFYSPATNSIYLNRSGRHDQVMMGVIGFHELLGIAGKAEPEFMISLSAYELVTSSRKLTEAHYNLLISMISRQSPLSRKSKISVDDEILYLAGGTVIGSGGDSETLTQRILFSNYLSKSSNRSHYLGNKIRVSIEVIDSDSTKIQYILDPRNTNGWPRHILVPQKMTQLPPKFDLSAPNLAIEDIGFYFASIIPTFVLPHFQAHSSDVRYYSSAAKANFFYPQDSTIVHPEAMRLYYVPKWQRLCPHPESCIIIEENR